MSSDFWDFSNQVYREENVATACLSLQDKNNADVNMLLFCVWTAVARHELADAAFDEALTYSRFWSNDVVRPLRAVRTAMKRDISQRSAFRENIKALKLHAEKLQQDELEAMMTANATPLQSKDSLHSAVANLKRYCRAEEISLGTENIDHLRVILTATFPAARSKVTRSLFS